MIQLNDKQLIFITGNMDKLAATKKYIHIPVTHKKLHLTEIQSLDPREVVEHKVKEAYRIVQQPVLVEDTSLVFHALGKLPGPLIKWFYEELGNDGMCALLGKDRRATATVTFALYDGKHLHFCDATARGSVPEKPRGESGFGWNPIFIPEGTNKTYAEMTEEEKDKIYLRRYALQKLKEIL